MEKKEEIKNLLVSRKKLCNIDLTMEDDTPTPVIESIGHGFNCNTSEIISIFNLRKDISGCFDADIIFTTNDIYCKKQFVVKMPDQEDIQDCFNNFLCTEDNEPEDKEVDVGYLVRRFSYKNILSVETDSLTQVILIMYKTACGIKQYVFDIKDDYAITNFIYEFLREIREKTIKKVLFLIRESSNIENMYVKQTYKQKVYQNVNQYRLVCVLQKNDFCEDTIREEAGNTESAGELFDMGKNFMKRGIIKKRVNGMKKQRNRVMSLHSICWELCMSMDKE